MKKRVFGLSAGLYCSVLLLVVISSSTSALAQVGCTTNGYRTNPAWSSNFYGRFYWDGSTPSSLNQTIIDGMAVWNNAPYRSPVFNLTTDPGIAQGVVRFESIDDCGAPDPAACTGVNTTGQSWYTAFSNKKNSSTGADFYCFVSTAEGAVAGCYNVGHIMNHEYGHVMTLDENDTNSGNDSLVSRISLSTDSRGVVRTVLGCADANALNARYGHL